MGRLLRILLAPPTCTIAALSRPYNTGEEEYLISKNPDSGPYAGLGCKELCSRPTGQWPLPGGARPGGFARQKHVWSLCRKRPARLGAKRIFKGCAHIHCRRRERERETYMYIYMYTYIYIYVYVYTYVFTYLFNYLCCSLSELLLPRPRPRPAPAWQAPMAVFL